MNSCTAACIVNVSEYSYERVPVIIRTKDLKAIQIDFKQSEELALVSDSLEKLCEIG